jgi:hypothetical protein
MTAPRAQRTIAALSLLALVALAERQGRGQEVPSPEAAEAARRLFREGAQAAEEGRWLDARDRFRRALSVRPSPLLHYNLALASQNAGYLVEAVDQYRSFLRIDSDPANVARRVAAQRAIAAIEPVLARVLISAPTSEAIAVLAIDGRALPQGLWDVEIPLDPGEHFIDARGARGSVSHRSIVVREGESMPVALQWIAAQTSAPNAEAGVEAGADATVDGAAAVGVIPSRRAPAAAPMSTIERVRRRIEENARETDVTGARPWERTFVVYGLLGTGATAGVIALGARWAARPWYEVDAQFGIGHPFGPGVQFYPAIFRAVWSYQFASTVQLGIGTNLTELPRGDAAPPMGASCLNAGPFTPLWLTLAIGNEFRIARGAGAVRFVIGARYLANNREMVEGLRSRCTTPTTRLEPRDLFFDPPTLDHTVFPLFPFFAFDAGYAI